MARVRFEVRHRFEAPARRVWDELVDWEGHGAWIPATRVDVEPGPPTEPGARFTAHTGYGPLTLEDRMVVISCDWSDDLAAGECEVEKLGPVLLGTAGFTVEPTGSGSELVWLEDVTVPWVPQFLAPVVGFVGAQGFKAGMRSLAKVLRASAA